MPGHGFDFFSGNGRVWEQVDAHPPEFVIVGGVTGITSYFDRYGGRSLAYDFAQARTRGIARSAYGLYVEGIDPVLQAKALVDLVNRAGGADFPLALDLEVWGSTPHPIAANVYVWLQTVEALSGRRPLIYTSKGMWDAILGPTIWASSYDLWVANYPGTQPAGWHEPPSNFVPLLPDPWAKAGKTWLIWQYGGGGLDLNVFKGEVSDFQDYLVKFRSKRMGVIDTIRADADITGLADNTESWLEVTLKVTDAATGVATRVQKEYQTTLGEIRSWTPGGTTPAPDKLYAVGTPWTNLRSKPSVNSARVGQLPPGALIQVVGNIAVAEIDAAGNAVAYHWAQIVNSPTYNGDYVAREYLSPTRP